MSEIPLNKDILKEILLKTIPPKLPDAREYIIKCSLVCKKWRLIILEIIPIISNSLSINILCPFRIIKTDSQVYWRNYPVKGLPLSHPMFSEEHVSEINTPYISIYDKHLSRKNYLIPKELYSLEITFIPYCKIRDTIIGPVMLYGNFKKFYFVHFAEEARIISVRKVRTIKLLRDYICCDVCIKNKKYLELVSLLTWKRIYIPKIKIFTEVIASFGDLILLECMSCTPPDIEDNKKYFGALYSISKGSIIRKFTSESNSICGDMILFLDGKLYHIPSDSLMETGIGEINEDYTLPMYKEELTYYIVRIKSWMVEN